MSTETLLLNASYEPIQLVSWRKAVALIMLCKAELIAQYEKSIVGVSGIFPRPRIVRLNRYVSVTARGVRFSRRALFRRDSYTCQYCGKKITDKTGSVDHFLAKSRGGTTAWHNVLTACVPCNNKKADRAPFEVGLSPLSLPKEPDWTNLVLGPGETLDGLLAEPIGRFAINLK